MNLCQRQKGEAYERETSAKNGKVTIYCTFGYDVVYHYRTGFAAWVIRIAGGI